MAHGGKREGAGRPEGSKNKRTEQWEALCESIVGEHADNFNATLSDLMTSNNEKNRLEGARLYCQVLEYFKPKYSRVEHSSEEGKEPIKIIIGDKV